jgi:hypothetical protein
MWTTNPVTSVLLWVAMFAVNVFVTPVLLIGKALAVFVFPCIKESVHTVFYHCCSGLISSTKFVDAQFDASSTSLGKLEAGGGVDWARLTELEFQVTDSAGAVQPSAALSMQLFAGGIEPGDICQGALGDCWLLAALAALSEQPHYIRRIFLTGQLNPRGKYNLRLYDPPSRAWITVIVDDRIPCSAGTKRPKFSNPKGNEAWTLLIEKGFAKYQKSYANIEGGFMLYALNVFTGCSVAHFSRRDDGWHSMNLDVTRGLDTHKPDEVGFRSDDTAHRALNDDEMFDRVVNMCRNRCILAAGSKGKDNTRTDGRTKDGGIVPGHAYSILGAYKPMGTSETIRLVKLRNPWGSFEWKGDWSDTSDKWKQHPLIKLELAPNLGASDDGMFFMAWVDFLSLFGQIDVCMTGGDGLDSVVYTVEEDWGKCGPTVGCCVGCGKYWCLCGGCYRLWCAPQQRSGRSLEDVSSNPYLPVLPSAGMTRETAV